MGASTSRPARPTPARARARTRLCAWAARRPVVAAGALYTVLALLMFAPGLVPGRALSASDLLWAAAPWQSSRPASVPGGLGSNGELADAVTQFFPQQRYVRGVLPHVPLWDPGMLGGRPLVADPQSQVFSPFSVPVYLLPFFTGVALAAVLKLLVAALGAFVLGRAVGMRLGGALLCGLVFGFSLWTVTWTSWTLGSVWVLLPWVCALAERCVRRPGPLPVAGLAAAVGLQFLGGHPSSSFQVLAVVGAFWLGRVLLDRRRRRGLPRRLLAPALGLGLGTALAAVMLVPFVELLAHSNDLQARAGASDLLHQAPRFLLGVFLPDYWGHGTTSQVFGSVQAEHAYYVAALPLMLAALALAVRPRLERVAVAGVGALALATAVGLSPVYDALVALPGFQSSNNGRLAVVTVLSLAVLAGWGLDELSGPELARRRRRLAVGLGVVLLAVPVVLVARRLEPGALGPALKVAARLGEPRATDPGGAGAVLRLASVVVWLVLAGAAVGLLALRAGGRLRATTFVALALALVAVDLFRAGLGYNPAIPRSHAEQPTTGALRFLQGQGPARFTGLKPRTPTAFALPLPPNLAMGYGLHDARGYVLPSEERVATLWRQAIAPSPDCYYFFCTVIPASTPRALHALGVLGVGLLLQDPRDPPLRGARLAYTGPDARVYRNPRAVPRTFLVDRQVVADSPGAALATVADPAFPTASAAVVERRLPGLREGASGASSPPGRARIAVYGAERVTVAAEADRPSLLVLTDSWYPGWRATVDGRSVPIHRVDYVARGVPVPAGAHRVELRYRPLSFRIGWVVSLLALAALAVLVVVGRRRRGATGSGAAGARIVGARRVRR